MSTKRESEVAMLGVREKARMAAHAAASARKYAEGMARWREARSGKLRALFPDAEIAVEALDLTVRMLGSTREVQCDRVSVEDLDVLVVLPDRFGAPPVTEALFVEMRCSCGAVTGLPLPLADYGATVRWDALGRMLDTVPPSCPTCAIAAAEEARVRLWVNGDGYAVVGDVLEVSGEGDDGRRVVMRVPVATVREVLR